MLLPSRYSVTERSTRQGEQCRGSIDRILSAKSNLTAENTSRMHHTIYPCKTSADVRSPVPTSHPREVIGKQVTGSNFSYGSQYPGWYFYPKRSWGTSNLLVWLGFRREAFNGLTASVGQVVSPTATARGPRQILDWEIDAVQEDRLERTDAWTFVAS